MQDVSKVSELENLAYLSAEKTFEVDLLDSHPRRWLKSKMNEIKSIVLEHRVCDVMPLDPVETEVHMDTKGLLV